MASSLARYLRFYKNRTDLILILLTAIVVYLPNSVVQNPSGWSLRVHEESPPSPGKILLCEERKIVEKLAHRPLVYRTLAARNTLSKY